MNAVRTRRNGSQARPGYTLLELVTGSAMATVLMAGLGSAIIIATQAVAIPDRQKSVMDAAEATFVIADDLHEAIHVSDHSSSHISFVVGDRNFDQSDETIKWEFTDQAQLTRSIGQESGVLLSNLSLAQFAPRYRTQTETLGGIVSESASAMMSRMNSATYTYRWKLKADQSLGQYVNLTHPTNCVLWSINELQLVLRRSGSFGSSERVIVRIHEAGSDGLPTSSILGETELSLTSLSTTWQWVTLPITVERLLPAQDVCIVLMTDETAHKHCHVYYGRYGFTSTGMLLRNYSHDFDFTTSTTRSLYYSLSGTRHLIDGTTHDVTRSYFAGCDLTVKTSESSDGIRRNVRLMNTPEDVNNVLRLDFDSHPANGIDVNYDGIEDWQTMGTWPATQFSDSQMTMAAGCGLQTSQTADFTGVLTIEAHLQPAAAAGDGDGAILTVPFQRSSRWGELTLQLQKSDNKLLTATVRASTDTDEQIVARATGLADQMTEVRIVVDPAHAQAAVWINDSFQGRTEITLPLSASSQRVSLQATGTDVYCDFLSIRESRD